MLISVFSTSVGFTQTARDYYFPAANKNLSVYATGFRMGSAQNETRVYVKDYGDSALITTLSNLVVMTNNNRRPDAWEQTIKVSQLEITATHGKAATENGLKTFDRNGEVLFKIPARHGEIVEWNESNPKGALKTIYRSEYANIKVDGKKIDAVKVSCVHKRIHSGEEIVFYVDYYVSGIGRYKRSTENGLDIEILAKQEYDPNVPVLN
jgi:hypothetical protein